MKDGAGGSESLKKEEIIRTQLSLVHNQLDQGKGQQALETMRPLAHDNPNNPEVLSTLGLIHMALGNAVQGLKILRQAYGLKHDTHIGLNLSSALIANRRHGEALRLLKSLAATGTKYEFRERIYHNMGLVYEQAEKFPVAIRFYRKALEENPTYYLSKYQLAMLYKKLGKPQVATKEMEDAAKFCPVCIAPVNELVFSYLNAGESIKAVALLRSFISLKEATQTDKDQASHLLSLAQKQAGPITRD